jgi:hypothetical protein
MAHAAALAQLDVRIVEPDNHTDMPNFARLVNSADVMMGVHGAGLTNMVFLPSRAVLVQVVPFVTFFVLLARIGFFFQVLSITFLICSSGILVIIFLVPMFLFLVSFFYLLIDRVVEDAGVG